MIEIDLFPGHLRVEERAPLLPVLVAAFAALMLAAAVLFLRGELEEDARLREELALVRSRLEGAKAEAAAVAALEARIAVGRARLEAVEDIAATRIAWSLKLQQLVGLMPESMWLEQLSFAHRDDGSGELKLAVSGRGTSFAPLTAFKRALREDSAFFQHFEAVRAPSAVMRPTPPGCTEPRFMSFPVTLPLKPRPDAGLHRR